jgi:hypothetical protein
MTFLERLVEKIDEVESLIDNINKAIKDKGVDFEDATLSQIPALVKKIPSKDNIPNARNHFFGEDEYIELVDDNDNILCYDEEIPLII